MNNYNLKAIKERNEQVFLETSFYSLPVYTTQESIKNELQKCFNQSSEEVLNSKKVELNWINEKDNLTILSKLLSDDKNALFLPEEYRQQVVNAYKRQQPCYFFIEKGIWKDFRGSWVMRLKQSCEAKPHKKGFKHGYSLSIVFGTAIHEVLLNGSLQIVDIIKHENKLLLNTVFAENR